MFVNKNEYATVSENKKFSEVNKAQAFLFLLRVLLSLFTRTGRGEFLHCSVAKRRASWPCGRLIARLDIALGSVSLFYKLYFFLAANNIFLSQ